MFSEIFVLAQNPSSQPGTIMGIPILYIVVFGGAMLLSWLVSNTLQRRFREYSQIPLRVTGAQVAEMMLRQNGINDVRVVSVGGQLTDHYDPSNKTVNLSEGVYAMNSVAAAAVAAHECGHAVQHQKAYAWLTLRSKLVPAVQFSSRLVNIVLMVGMVMLAFSQSPTILWLGVALFSVTTLFALVTLPVEFDASRRALVWLEGSGLAASMEHEKAKNALFWAAMTYVVGALGSIGALAYYIMLATGARREE